MIEQPSRLNYPIVAIGDLHGQRAELERLIPRLVALPDWPDCSVVFLGDFVDRGADVRGTIELVLELLRTQPAGGSAVLGNHDLALIRAARLDGGSRSPYWLRRYRDRYDHQATFESYLGRSARLSISAWEEDLDALRGAMPEAHRSFLASLAWVVEAPGHLFLHNGLSPELSAPPEVQVEALRAKRWDRTQLDPKSGTNTALLWEDAYPAWIGADRTLSASPLYYPGKIQVTGHERVSKPNAVRIRLDTSGGLGRLTACLLKSAEAEPSFISSR